MNDSTEANETSECLSAATILLQGLPSLLETEELTTTLCAVLTLGNIVCLE